MIAKNELKSGEKYYHQFRGYIEHTEACAVIEQLDGIDPTSSFFYIIDEGEIAELTLALISKQE
jgi:hypothetical protein